MNNHDPKRNSKRGQFKFTWKGQDEIMSPKSIIFVLTIAMVLAGASSVMATDDYAMETGQECSVCHMSASGGGGLTRAGESYSEDPQGWKAPEKTPGRTPFYLKIVHSMILYAHVFFGIIWIGTILYVHLILKPKYAIGGLPRGELRLAWISMPMIALTGILLTVWRVRLSPGLFSTMFGKLLIAKIVVFTLMVCSAAFVTRFVGPRLKALAEAHHSDAGIPEKGRFNPDSLDDFDGIDGRRSFIAAHGRVYDVSSSKMWKNGAHAGRHKAGQDLTEYLNSAPHEAEVLERFEFVGEYVEGQMDTPAIIKIFTFNAYFNLAGCFIIILLLVLWRW